LPPFVLIKNDQCRRRSGAINRKSRSAIRPLPNLPWHAVLEFSVSSSSRPICQGVPSKSSYNKSGRRSLSSRPLIKVNVGPFLVVSWRTYFKLWWSYTFLCFIVSHSCWIFKHFIEYEYVNIYIYFKKRYFLLIGNYVQKLLFYVHGSLLNTFLALCCGSVFYFKITCTSCVRCLHVHCTQCV
jgi:hypothetical protein